MKSELATVSSFMNVSAASLAGWPENSTAGGFSEDGRGDGNLLQLDASSKIAAINRLKKIIKQLNCQSPVFLLAAEN